MPIRAGRIARLALMLALAGAACREPASEVPRGPASIAGIITTVTPRDSGGSVRVEAHPDSSSGSAKAVVFVTPATVILLPGGGRARDFSALATGQRVRVWFTGPVRESYPVQADAATIVVDSTARARSAAPGPTAGAARGDAASERIDAYVATVDRELATYRCRTLELWGYSAEGGELRACYADDELRLLHARHFGESGRAEDRIYFQDDELAFVLGSGEQYTAPLSGVVRSREEERLWFADGQLTRWVGGDGAAQSPTSAEAREQAGEYRTLIAEFLACLRDETATECEK